MATTVDANGLRRNRDRGRYARETRCDACGRAITMRVDRESYATDSDVCGATDGPGFYLCLDRPACDALIEGKSVDERRALYTAQRAKNEAKAARAAR